MSKIYIEIFDQKRLSIWKRLSQFNDIGVLAGGTGLALQINHRKSYDFDIFCEKVISKNLLYKVRKVFWEEIVEPKVDDGNELSVLLSGEIKLSFVYFPFSRLEKTVKTDSIDIFSINDLLANKAYAVGRRGVWRDYVDIYWAIKNGISSLDRIIKDTAVKFNGLFAEKLFLEQLVFFDDLREDEVEWISKSTKNISIKTGLEQIVKKYLAR